MSKELKNIDLNLSSKQKFSIDGDESKIIELDLNDLNVLTRLKTGIKKADEIQFNWSKISAMEKNVEDLTTDDVMKFSDEYDNLENEMRKLVDYIFDCENMCNIILGSASIFSPVNGKFKYEQIISTICELYETSIKTEAEKINKRKISEKTAKYVHK